MAVTIPENHPLRNLFRRAVEKGFQEERELYSPEVASHLGDELLPDFVHVDRIYRLKSGRGKRLEDLPDMVQVAHEKEGPERRMEVDRYIGDFVLFMGGFFPNSLRRHRWFTPQPMVAKVGGILVSFTQPLDYYVAEGRNAYGRAATTARIFDPPASRTYRQLGEHLDRYLEFLSRVKVIMERDPLFRKVEGIIE
jgi:hypothetical protein